MSDLAAASLIWLGAAILGALAFLLFNASTQARSIMSVQAVVDGLVVQVAKVKDELVNRLAELQMQVDAAGVTEKVDLSDLSAAIQGLDDIVPDDDDEPVVADPEPVPVEATE